MTSLLEATNSLFHESTLTVMSSSRNFLSLLVNLFCFITLLLVATSYLTWKHAGCEKLKQLPFFRCQTAWLQLVFHSQQLHFQCLSHVPVQRHNAVSLTKGVARLVTQVHWISPLVNFVILSMWHACNQQWWPPPLSLACCYGMRSMVPDRYCELPANSSVKPHGLLRSAVSCCCIPSAWCMFSSFVLWSFSCTVCGGVCYCELIAFTWLTNAVPLQLSTELCKPAKPSWQNTGTWFSSLSAKVMTGMFCHQCSQSHLQNAWQTQGTAVPVLHIDFACKSHWVLPVWCMSWVMQDIGQKSLDPSICTKKALTSFNATHQRDAGQLNKSCTWRQPNVNWHIDGGQMRGISFAAGLQKQRHLWSCMFVQCRAQTTLTKACLIWSTCRYISWDACGVLGMSLGAMLHAAWHCDYNLIIILLLSELQCPDHQYMITLIHVSVISIISCCAISPQHHVAASSQHEPIATLAKIRLADMNEAVSLCRLGMPDFCCSLTTCRALYLQQTSCFANHVICSFKRDMQQSASPVIDQVWRNVRCNFRYAEHSLQSAVCWAWYQRFCHDDGFAIPQAVSWSSSEAARGATAGNTFGNPSAKCCWIWHFCAWATSRSTVSVTHCCTCIFKS